MPNHNYLKGYALERCIVKYLQDLKSPSVIRSPGSKGVAAFVYVAHSTMEYYYDDSFIAQMNREIAEMIHTKGETVREEYDTQFIS
jgi:hypothetical protein